METASTVDDPVEFAPFATCLPDAFFRHVLAHNPFTLNRASADGAEGPDVVPIHAEVFGRLTELATEAVRLHRGLGVLLSGEAGSGKSHLLGRLARWSAVGGRACFVVVRGLQTDPELLPAAVLRSAGAALAGRPGAKPIRTPLYRLAHNAARVGLADNQERYSWERVGRAFAKLADRFAPSARRVPEGRSAFDLIFRFFRSAARAMEGKETGETAEMILRWLTGGMLDAREARRLSLPPARHRDDPVTLTDPEWARQGLTMLAVMATAVGRPLVLAIDQAEELDSARFAALARFLNGLLDQVPGLLTVTAAETEAVLSWRDRGVVPASSWDRLAQFTLEPTRLRPSEAIALVSRRLDEALSPFRQVEFLYRLRADAPLFPLHLELNDCGVWAREALEAARLAWNAEQEVLRRDGGAGWLSGWAERVSLPAEENSSSELDGESSLTREQVLAAIAVRARASSSAADTENPEADSPADEADASDSPAAGAAVTPDVACSLTFEQLQAAIVERQMPQELSADQPIHEEPRPDVEHLSNGDGSQPTAAPCDEEAAIASDNRGVAELAEAAPAVTNGANSTAEPAPLQSPAPAAAAADVAATPEPQRASAPMSSADILLPDSYEGLPMESPTLFDPDAIRHRQVPPPAEAAEPADAAVLAFAPSERKRVLTPRAWPPSAPAPGPRDESVDLAVAAFIADYLAARGPRRELPADAEQVAELILNLLQQCHNADPGYGIIQAERVPSWKATPAACDLVVRQRANEDAFLRTGVLVLTGNRATAIAGYLRRLTTESQPFDRLFLITEGRIGLPLGPRGMEYFQELQQRTSVPLHTLELSVEEHSELSALRAAARQARGGTLVADGGLVTEAEVIASHHRQERYLASRFLSAILFDALPPELAGPTRPPAQEGHGEELASK